MPYILSPLIKENMTPLWFEGSPYEKENIYKIADNKMPPINYDKHILKPHSLTHAESEKHICLNGKSIDQYFSSDSFFGKCHVIKLRGNNYKKIDSNIYHWEITENELLEEIKNIPHLSKIIISTEFYPKNIDGFHDPNYVLTLSSSAANYLASLPDFNLYGTSWKSSDYMPGKKERPIHKTLFTKAIILECLDLENVPAGEYFLSAFPLRLENASESPLTPVLFTKHEISNIF